MPYMMANTEYESASPAVENRLKAQKMGLSVLVPLSSHEANYDTSLNVYGGLSELSASRLILRGIKQKSVIQSTSDLVRL